MYMFFGHHKCATGWINSVIREICYNLGWNFKIINQEKDFQEFGSLGNYADNVKPDFLSYNNANFPFLKDVTFTRGFHVIRDPRDIIVSAYFSHLYSHDDKNWPELTKHRNQLQKVSINDGLFIEMDFSEQFLEKMYSWNYKDPRILEIKMENLTSDPLKEFDNILRYLDLTYEQKNGRVQQFLIDFAMFINTLNQRGKRFIPFHLSISPFRIKRNKIPKGKVYSIIKKRNFKKQSGGRKPGQENIKHHYRKGIPGDWKNYFTNEHILYFKEKYKDLLIKLDYEKNNSWK